MGETTGSPVTALKSLGFRYDAVEDRIRCVAVPAGLATGQLGFWLTQRLAFQFMEKLHKSFGTEKTESGRPEPQAMTRYGAAMSQAKQNTATQIGRLSEKQQTFLEGEVWLVTKLSVQTIGKRYQLFFFGKGRSAGLPLSQAELMRVIDMMESAFAAAGWKLPQGSYRNLGAYLAESEGQRLN